MTDFARLIEITRPYWAAHGMEVPLRQLTAHMTEAERAEVTAILDRGAPAGD